MSVYGIGTRCLFAGPCMPEIRQWMREAATCLVTRVQASVTLDELVIRGLARSQIDETGQRVSNMSYSINIKQDYSK